MYCRPFQWMQLDCPDKGWSETDGEWCHLCATKAFHCQPIFLMGSPRCLSICSCPPSNHLEPLIIIQSLFKLPRAWLCRLGPLLNIQGQGYSVNNLRQPGPFLIHEHHHPGACYPSYHSLEQFHPGAQKWLSSTGLFSSLSDFLSTHTIFLVPKEFRSSVEH